MAFHHSPRIVSSGLILTVDGANVKSYPGSGTTWNDISGGRTGTLENGPVFSTAGGGSIDFDGSNDYISFDSTITQLSDYTINAWFFVDVSSAAQGIITWGQNSSGKRRAMLIWNGGSGTNYYLRSSTHGSNPASTTVMSSGQWWNGTVSLASNGTAKIYVNGALENTSTNSLSTPSSNAIYIGATSTGTEFFNGKIAIINVYDRVLSDVEVLKNYNAMKGRFE